MQTQHVEMETYIDINDVFVISQTIDGDTQTIFILGDLAAQIRDYITEYLIITDQKQKN